MIDGFSGRDNEMMKMDELDTIKKPLMWTAAWLLATSAAGCGGGDPVLGNAQAVLAPTVTVVEPANGALGVPTNNTVVSADFSERIAAMSGGASFTLTCVTPCVNPPGAVSLNASNRIASFTLTPATTLAPNVLYTATVTAVKSLATGVSLASPYVWRFTTGAITDTTRPRVALTAPVTGATGVATNTRIASTFSEGMIPATFTGTSFTLSGPGTTPVAGTVTYGIGGKVATFMPSSSSGLATNTLFTATITSAVTDLAGNALAANTVWTFTTGAFADLMAPTVILLKPLDLAVGVAVNNTVNATFSEGMDTATLNTATFTVQGSGSPSHALSGTVTYDAARSIATFAPASPLDVNTSYVATLTTGVMDLAGLPLAANKSWTFTTGASAVVAPAVTLLSAAPLGAAGGTGVTSCGNTVINGDVSTTSASTLITGLTDGNGFGNPYTIDGCPGVVNGKVFTAPPAPGDASSLAIATQAQTDAQSAFNATSVASMPGGITHTAELGAKTLTPGVYTSGTSFDITTVDLTLDAKGNPNAVWVFQSPSTLTVGAGVKVILTNGAQPKNVFWHIGSAATINAGAQMKGTLLAFSGVSMGTGATLDGRAISLVGGPVTLLSNVINVPAP